MAGIIKDITPFSVIVKNNLKIPFLVDISSVSPQGAGSLVFNDADSKVYASTGSVWTPLDGGYINTTLSSVGSGASIVNDGTGPSLAVKSLSVGTGLSLVSSATDLLLTNTSVASSITLTDAGTMAHETLLSNDIGPNFTTKGLQAGSNVILSSTATDIIINSIAPLPQVITLTSAGGTYSLAGPGVSPNLTVKGLTPGTGITMMGVGATEIIISAPNAEFPVTLSSTGGQPLVVDGGGPDLTIRGLTGQLGEIDIYVQPTDLLITLAGGPISLTSAGTLGSFSLAGPSVGNSLKTKGLIAGTGIVITCTATDCTISSTASGAIVNSVTAGPGILIGGTASDPVVINLNPTVPTLTAASINPYGLVFTSGGPNMVIKGITPGPGIIMTDLGTDIQIESLAFSITITNAGVAPLNESLVAAPTGGIAPNFQTKGLVAGTGIGLSSTNTDITITNTSPSAVVLTATTFGSLFSGFSADIPTADNAVTSVEVAVVASRTDVIGESMAQWMKFAVRKTAGVMTQLSTTDNLFQSDAGAATWFVNVNLAGTDIALGANGEIGKIVSWKATYRAYTI